MRLPARVILNGVEYEVVHDSEIDSVLEAGGVLGDCAYESQRISVRTDIPADRIRKVFLHELLHGLLYEYDFGQWNNEELVHKLAAMLFAFVQANDVSWLIGGGDRVSEAQDASES